MRSLLAVVVVVAFAGSCHYGIADISAVPDKPTYNADVYPLFRDHCLVCHGFPPDRGAPSYFRLDVYDDTNGVPGAMSMAFSALADVKSNRMPPTAKAGEGVGPNGLAMLQKWVDNGTPQ
jgi:hypothetical protein